MVFRDRAIEGAVAGQVLLNFLADPALMFSFVIAVREPQVLEFVRCSRLSSLCSQVPPHTCPASLPCCARRCPPPPAFLAPAFLPVVRALLVDPRHAQGPGASSLSE